MIFVHEWGHFVAAKLSGVRVAVFSLGFGLRLFGVKRGDTDYRISALPFGGYVRMAGDNPVEQRSGAPDEFLSKPRWVRVLMAIAGPTMNILLAFAIFWGIFWIVG
ncbi:RIP metalloprotease RseP, partial [Lacticaseibacillus rhamnosus]